MFVISEIGSLVNISEANGIGVDTTPVKTWEIQADFGSEDNLYTLATFKTEDEARFYMEELALMISSCKNVNDVIDMRVICDKAMLRRAVS